MRVSQTAQTPTLPNGKIARLADRVSSLENQVTDNGNPESPDTDYYGQDWFKPVGTDYIEGWTVAGLIMGAGFPASVAVTTAQLTMVAHYTGAGGNFDAIAINQIGGAAASRTARVCIYSNLDGYLYPSDLMFDFAAYDCSATGVHSNTGMWKLPPRRLVWFGINSSNSAITVAAMNRDNVFPIGQIDSTISTNPNVGITVASTYGSPPTTFPQGGAWLTASQVPIIAYRRVP